MFRPYQSRSTYNEVQIGDNERIETHQIFKIIYRELRKFSINNPNLQSIKTEMLRTSY